MRFNSPPTTHICDAKKIRMRFNLSLSYSGAGLQMWKEQFPASQCFIGLIRKMTEFCCSHYSKAICRYWFVGFKNVFAGWKSLIPNCYFWYDIDYRLGGNIVESLKNIVILHWREEGCIGNYAPRGPRDLPKYWFCTPRPEKLPEGDAQEQSRGPNYQNYQSISVQSCSFQYNPVQPNTRWCFLCEDSEMKNFIPENVVDQPWPWP